MTSVYIERMVSADDTLSWGEEHADACWGTVLLQRHQLVFESDASDAQAFLVLVPGTWACQVVEVTMAEGVHQNAVSTSCRSVSMIGSAP